MSELKNCPFCGGSNIYVDGYDHDAGKRWRVVCLDCMATVDDGCIQQKYRAIEAWNRRADGWIPVTEMLPESGVHVLVYNGTFNEIHLAWLNGIERWADYFGMFAPNRITHWMPLPEPPKGATPCSD